jgi:hypothetical protein
MLRQAAAGPKQRFAIPPSRTKMAKPPEPRFAIADRDAEFAIR